MTARLAGRCPCGVSLEIAKHHPLDHRRCAVGYVPPDPWCSCGESIALDPKLHKVCRPGVPAKRCPHCKTPRPETMFYPDRVNSFRSQRRQSYCRFCTGESSRISYARKYREDAEFRERERARRRRPDAVRRTEPGAPAGSVQTRRQEAA